MVLIVDRVGVFALCFKVIIKMSNKKIINKKQRSSRSPDDDQEDGGDSGGGRGGGNGRFIPTYSDLIPTTADETALASGAAEALFEQRISLKTQGHKVSALEKLQRLREKMSDPAMAAELANSGGSNMAAHPELAELGGAFDDISFPESEAEAAARASNDPQLRNRLKAKLGMGGDVSALTLKEEYRKKQELNMKLGKRLEPEFDNKPRFRAAPTPKPSYH